MRLLSVLGPRRRASSRILALASAVVLLIGIVPGAAAAPHPAGAAPAAAPASHTPTPTSVTIAGSLQSEAGCPGDWDPACATTQLTSDANDEVWQGTWNLPAGNWEYKAALNNTWTENYGAGAQLDGPNIGLPLTGPAAVKFFYDHATHWVTDNQTSVIATVPGSFQSELGCSSDWDPGCLRSWLQDSDGDGTYELETTALPAATYEAKLTIDEDWAENYGAGGVPNGPNIPFTVPTDNAPVTFRYDATTHVLTILAGHAHDNNIEWDGLGHDSRDPLYRTPGGAVADDTAVTLRLRTFHGDVTSVRARLFSLDAGGQTLAPMTLAAEDVSCYQAALASERCDFWETTLPNEDPDNIWYRFIVTDGTDTDYYADNTPALDGGVGAPSDDPIDQSWALMVHVPGFTAPAWAQDAVIYQIFPDRFRNGRENNDPKTGDVRYDDPVIALDWGVKPEGFCRNYADGASNCPWRFDDTPPADSPTVEQPRGRDYFGGDLKGVDQRLEELAALGVTVLYFNPIFDAGSNHSYDTQDYTKVDPAFGTQKDFDNLIKHASRLGIRIVLDGVFNHMSSDSPFFDRYHHYPEIGACESVNSPWRAWFVFTPDPAGPCAGPDGGKARYEGWFGFDSIPVLAKSNEEVQAYFLTAPASVTKRWLAAGAAGWRMDVSGDASFPNGYWETFRDVVKAAKPDALTISETWQKDSTLLRMLRGDRLDTTMNYRIRDAVLGLLAPGTFDSKGFADSGRIIEPSEFANRMLSIREDYPDAAYSTLMNLLDSHDTERLLWTLTPGPETTAGREDDATNLAAGKLRQQLASLIQFTVPGAPTVYYGDEVAVTGDDDPDDRRTYPWADLGFSPDTQMRTHYATLAALRDELAVLRDGDLRFLLADDGDDTLAYGLTTGNRAAVVALNRSGSPRTLDLDVPGYLPDGTALERRYGVGVAASGSATVAGGQLSIELPAMSGLLLASGPVDLAGPDAPANLHVTAEGPGTLELAWNAVSGAAGYDVWISPLSGGGYVKANDAPVAGTSFTVTGLDNARTYYAIVRALDAAGNASEPSNEVVGLPHLTIGWANLQWPPTMNHVISTVDRTDTAYGQVWIDGETSAPGATPSLTAQLGFGPDASDPDGNPDWTWVDATFNVDTGNNDEYAASLQPEVIGTFDYVYRYSTTGGRDWLYADLNGPIATEAIPPNPGSLTVSASGDTMPPAAPAGLTVISASPAGIELEWDAVVDPTLHGYEVRRGDEPGGPYVTVGSSSGTSFTDTGVVEGTTYVYVVRAVDTSFNRSGPSNEVEATAELRTVTLTFNVTVPSTTDATGRDVNIAGFVDRLDGGWPQWNPSGAPLTRVDATHWTITFTGKESTQLEYKYVLEQWEYVEKDDACGEISNRLLTLSWGSNGTQIVNDVVPNWRNVAPCGN
jgi:glycosidase